MGNGMDYREQIEKAIEYIEENLQCEISLAECARVSGYSPYHFLRVFRSTVGLTPSDYIRKRRITEISREMMQGKQYLSSIAFRYGFNSKENFIRAFKKEHQILPTEYKKAQNSLKLYEKFRFETKECVIVPQIVELQPFSLTVYPCNGESVPNCWNKYNARGYSMELSGGREVWDYGACKWNCEENRLDYYIGIKTEYALGETRGTRKICIEGGLYAVFFTLAATRENFVAQIHGTWDYINGTWLRESGFARRQAYEFERYREKSRLFSEEIYIPVEKHDAKTINHTRR